MSQVPLDDSRLAGVPPELRPPLVEVLATEPVHRPGPLDFDRRHRRTRRFTLRELVRPARAALVLAVVLVGLESLLLQIGPLMVQRAIDRGILVGDLGAVVVAALLYLAAAVAGGAASGTRIWWTGHLGQQLTKTLRVHVFTHFQRLSQAYFTEERVGRLLTRMTSDIEALGQLLQDGIVNLLVQGFTLAVVTTLMLSLNVRLAVMVLVIVAPISTLLTLWFRRASERTYGRVRECIAELLADLQENLSGARIITASNRQRYNEVTHRTIVGLHRDAEVDAGNISGFYGPTIQACGHVGQIAVLAIGGAMVLDGSLSVGELTAFVLYLGAFFAPIQQLVNLYNAYQSGQAAVTKLADLLDDQPTVVELDDPVELTEVQGRVAFEHVTFAYHPGQPVLHDVSLEIGEGDTVAFVGATGAGKSTLARLLTRAWDPAEGRVLLDGIDVRELSLTSLRRNVGVVPQEPFLFGGTLRDNLVLGQPTVSDDAVIAVAETLGLGPLLRRLGGLDGRVGERGVGLSAGERQLIALARALVPEPHLLVLDEATSNLDLASERLVEHALDVALEGRTAIIVAHRLSTAERAERVVVLDHGRIVEFGHHDDLVTNGARYARMFATWAAASDG